MRISPTQISTYRACARRYAFEYAHDFRSPSTPSQEKGTAIHAILEDYLNGKGPIDATTELGAIAQAGVQFLPKPGEGKAEVELHLKPFGIDTFEFYGKIDLLTPTLVLDHKTTSDFRYAKTPEILRVDPQAILYGTFGAVSYPEFYQGAVRYVYYLTAKRKTAQARAVDFTFGDLELEDRFGEISEESEKLYQIRTKKPSALDLPPTLSACNDYGGCPHKIRCTDLNTTSNIIERIMLPGKDELMSKLLQSAGIAPKDSPVTPPVEETKPMIGTLENPSTTPPSELDEEAQLLAKLEAARAEKKAKAEAEAARIEAEKAAKAATPEVPSEPAKEEPKRGRGRPPGAKNKPKEGPVKSDPNYSGRPIGTLYVDCLPVGEEIFRADDLFATVREKMAPVVGVPHYKLVDYGKGTGIFSEAVREQVVATFEGQDLFVDSRTLEGADALSALCQCASSVVRGLR